MPGVTSLTFAIHVAGKAVQVVFELVHAGLALAIRPGLLQAFLDRRGHGDARQLLLNGAA